MIDNSNNYQRVFLAIPIEKDLRTYIHQAVRQCYPNISTLRWINKENYHITLHYLGELSQTQLEALSKKLKPIINHFSSFSLKLETSSGFPLNNNVHTLIINVKLSFLLNNLYEETKKVIQACGLTPSSVTYTPHLSVAKIKKDNWVIYNKRLPTPFKISVQEIALFESLSEENQTYFKKIESFNLNHYKVEA